jgi:hypothetical protein
MLIEGRLDQPTNHWFDPKTRAENLYRRACSQNWLGQVWSALTGRSRHLLNLASVQATCSIGEHHYAGIQTVPISQIRGSGNTSRSMDFDVDFRPLRAHNKARWLGIAAAQQRGAKLPPISLIQVGGTYFISDGHHRVSVARALGHKEIEARVTVWQVAGSLPWQSQMDLNQGQLQS